MNLYFIRAFLHPILVRHAAQAPTTPDGTVRVRMYWIHSLLGFAGIFLGLLLMAFAVPTYLSSIGQLIIAALFALLFFIMGGIILLAWKNVYIQTGVDYVEQRLWVGVHVRIHFNEIDSFSYNPGNTQLTMSRGKLGGWLSLKTTDNRRIAFQPNYYRGERTIAAIAFRLYYGRWPSPTNPHDQQILVNTIADGSSKQYLIENSKGSDLTL